MGKGLGSSFSFFSFFHKGMKKQKFCFLFDKRSVFNTAQQMKCNKTSFLHVEYIIYNLHIYIYIYIYIYICNL